MGIKYIYSRCRRPPHGDTLTDLRRLLSLSLTLAQFINDLLTHFHQETSIKHHTTIQYSKEENGIVERANKEVNRHKRNNLFVLGPVINWSRLLCTTERVLNNFVKQPLGVSPNTLLFGNAFSTDRSLLTQIDQDVSVLNNGLHRIFSTR